MPDTKIDLPFYLLCSNCVACAPYLCKQPRSRMTSSERFSTAYTIRLLAPYRLFSIPFARLFVTLTFLITQPTPLRVNNNQYNNKKFHTILNPPKSFSTLQVHIYPYSYPLTFRNLTLNWQDGGFRNGPEHHLVHTHYRRRYSRIYHYCRNYTDCR
jgi:hypothetical protein